MTRQKNVSSIALVLLFVSLSIPALAQHGAEQKQKKSKNDTAGLPAVIWRDPGNISTLDLIDGIGGREHAPDPSGTFKFDREDLEGTSPKFDATDAQGVKWRVKLGQEPQSETAAARLLWAAGYIVDEDYFLPQIKVEGLPKLRRGEAFVSEDGVVQRARLKRKNQNIKKIGNWDWFKNPFVGSKEFNGLRVMMALLNNWDLKEVNNAIYVVDGEQRFVVSDLGASFGKTGNTITRSKSNLEGYAESKFIDRETPTEVDFEMHSRPFALTVFNFPNYRERTKMEEITKRIPRADAKWLGQLLAQLSEEQIQDCFRCAGYTPEQVEGYSRAVEKRIAALNVL